MATPNANDVAALTDAVNRKLPPEWARYPGGWPGQIEAALVDAVLSIRATYGQPHNGVRGAVARWREHRGGDLAAVLHNHRKVSGRTLKAEAIVSAADALVKVGVRHSGDFDAASPAQRKAYIGVPGLGPVTWSYLGMLAGAEGSRRTPG
ncbi:MAG: hypothetical protein QOF68_3258 [Gaiellales bacterium]|jgi:hypothetical protein|nr:hypothetical protein [Gaiellales bacterium]